MSVVGGVLADHVDRRRLLIAMQLEQLVFSIVLAVLVTAHHPSRAGILACVLVIGIVNALSAPALSAILPTLVPRQDLGGAVSLQSVQMNLSRVIGPAIGAPLYVRFGAAPVFALNAATYLFAAGGAIAAEFPGRTIGRPEASGWERLLSGFRIAWHDPLIRRVLTTMTTLSFFSLTFIGLMPAIAATNLGIRPKSAEYGWLYAIFGLGAAIGAAVVGTLLVERSKEELARAGLAAFAVFLATFGLLRSPTPAYPVAMAMGFAYFLVITCLSTVLQEHLDDDIRGCVLALWIMAFGGTAPVGVLVGGYVVRATSITTVVLIGAGVAAVLALRGGLDQSRSGPVVGEVEDHASLRPDEAL